MLVIPYCPPLPSLQQAPLGVFPWQAPLESESRKSPALFFGPNRPPLPAPNTPGPRHALLDNPPLHHRGGPLGPTAPKWPFPEIPPRRDCLPSGKYRAKQPWIGQIFHAETPTPFVPPGPKRNKTHPPPFLPPVPVLFDFWCPPPPLFFSKQLALWALVWHARILSPAGWHSVSEPPAD